jgi:hypothetical protein
VNGRKLEFTTASPFKTFNIHPHSKHSTFISYIHLTIHSSHTQQGCHNPGEIPPTVDGWQNLYGAFPATLIIKLIEI